MSVTARDSAPGQASGKPVPYTADQLSALGLLPDRLPHHVAIIMDGNGRWARSKGWLRIRGHEAGVASVREATEECARLGLQQLTLYAFSSENWRRPETEVGLLMKLLARYVVEERPTLMRNGVRLVTIGETEKLPDESRRVLEETIALTAANDGLTLCLALNYGGRREIVSAARRLAREAAAGRLDSEAIDEDLFEKNLHQSDMPPLDLLVRTAGEYRVSNFLLWQLSYAEIWTTPVLWPEFRTPQLHEALRAFAQRERRFGGLGE